MSKAAILKDAWNCFRQAPFYFFILQLPVASSEAIDVFFSKNLEAQPAYAFLLLAVLCVLDYFCRALTFCSVISVSERRSVDFRPNLQKVRRAGVKLAAAALVFGAIWCLGFLAIIFPAIYFGAIYLFVPYLVVLEPQHKLSNYFNASKNYSRTCLWLTLTVALLPVVHLLFMMFFFSAKSLEVWAGAITADPTLRLVFLAIAKMGVAMLVSALIEVGIGHLFLKVQRSFQHEGSR